MISRATENFLKSIYDVRNERGWAKTSHLARRLERRPASVTNMIQKLAASELNLVKYIPYQGVQLTRKGELAALEIIRHHRLIELFLARVLDVPWDRVHEEAEQLEHALSEYLEDKLEAALGEATTDPHGSPIPTRDGSIPNRHSLPLTQIEAGVEVRVVEVYDHDPQLLRYLGDMGLYPGAEFKVLVREAFGNSLKILRKGKSYSLGEEAIPHISVETV
ncbi:MAG: metal-dependent transcriptional regulator [Verrucomicrobia bacterium]|nr:metal-dependent transcriptional regulator [Verrucomicrobiota bacterium]MDA1088283.1 metal-dependent transcriptional regulator [Verrucomicrobiota bacterium]